MFQPRLCIAALIMCAGLTCAAQADTINLVGGFNLIWDINQLPTTTSPSVAIQIQNATLPGSEVFNGYDLGFLYVRTQGAGDISLNAAVNPTTNSVVPTWVGAPVLSGQRIANQSSEAATDYVVPASPTNLVLVNFKSGATAPTVGSKFEVWSDDGWSDYYDCQGNIFFYANNETAPFLLGTVTVVPEPATLTLLLVTGGVFCSMALRRRRR